MNDFADFIRSTGPDKGASEPVTRPPEKRIRTRRGGERLQAREAQVRRSHNDELIALLKQGPPGETGSGARVTAPVRKPASSRFDQNSVASTVDSYANRSVLSTNSRTGLLPDAHSNAVRQNAVQRSAPEDGDMPKIKRTRRRVKDPYAISDDEDENDENITPTATGGGREESLADFLSSMTPPTEGNAPAPLYLSKETIREVQRRASNAGGNKGAAGAGHVSGNARATAAKARGGYEDNGARNAGQPRGNFQARDERAGKSSTSDLAAFLNSSAPGPDTMDSGPRARFTPQSGGGRGSESGFSKMFSRKRTKSGLA